MREPTTRNVIENEKPIEFLFKKPISVPSKVLIPLPLPKRKGKTLAFNAYVLSLPIGLKGVFILSEKEAYRIVSFACAKIILDSKQKINNRY